MGNFNNSPSSLKQSNNVVQQANNVDLRKNTFNKGVNHNTPNETEKANTQGVTPKKEPAVVVTLKDDSKIEIQVNSSGTLSEHDFYIDGKNILADAEEIVIPKGVTKIGDETFADCINLKEIEIPEGVTEIGFAAFGDCKRLEKVTLPSTLRKIGKRAFLGCESLGEIEVPEGVTEISDRAFESCYSLERVILPSTLTSIGKRIFADCYSVDIKKGGKDYSKVIRLLNLRDDVINSLNNLKNAIRYFPQRIKLERALKKIDYD